MKKVYLDTNVIMDIIQDRFDRPSMLDLISSYYIFVVSNVVIDELEYNKEEVFLFFDILKKLDKLIVWVATKDDIILGKDFMKYTHHNDALHAAICYNMNIPIATRNIKYFENLPIKTIHSSKL